MRIPLLYKQPHWQRFFSGIAIGGCISWIVFIYMYGIMQEKNSSTIERQAAQIKELTSHIEIWQEDYKKLNEKNSEMLTVQNIEVKLTNYERYDIKDKQSIFNMEENIKEDLQPILANELENVFNNKDIIIRTIENKSMNVNGKRYKFIVKEMFIYTTVHLTLEVRLAD